MTEATSRILRTVLQLIAGGALTALTDQIASDIPASYAPYIVLGYTLLVTAVQNYLEETGAMKPILKPDGGGETKGAA
jgi:hypothetical protein